MEKFKHIPRKLEQYKESHKLITQLKRFSFSANFVLSMPSPPPLTAELILEANPRHQGIFEASLNAYCLIRIFVYFCKLQAI